MPRLSVWLMRMSLVALVLGGGLGACLLAAEPWGSPWVVRLRLAHVHLMLFGWLLPFVLGTAYWMLPKHAEGEARGPAAAAWTGAGLVGGGVLVGAAGALLGAMALQRLGTLAVVAGGATFIGLLWPRVKQFGEGRLRDPSSRSP